MKDAIFYVEFTSPSTPGSFHHAGVAVFIDGTVNGGDNGYSYVGSYTENGQEVAAHLKIKLWNQGSRSVFGPIQEFELSLRGTVAPDEKTFQAQGEITAMPQMKITITGRRMADAIGNPRVE